MDHPIDQPMAIESAGSDQEILMSLSIYLRTTWIQQRVSVSWIVAGKLCLLTKVKKPSKVGTLRSCGVPQLGMI